MSFANQANVHAMISRTAVSEARIASLERENKQLRLNTNELHHRMKNIVAVVQAIARQTLRQSTTRDGFEVRFSARVGAIGRSLDLLIDNDWHGARIDEIVHAELAAFGALDGGQVEVSGPALALKPEVTRHLGMAIHELATNAAKYGALSVPEGKVVVRWRLVNGCGRRRLRMTWCESGGPTVTKPKHRGFGRQVIQQLTAQALTAEVTHEFLAAGVKWTLDVPAALVIDSRSAPIPIRASLNERNVHVSQ